MPPDIGTKLQIWMLPLHPVEATLHEESVEIGFNHSLGSVTVTVVNGSGSTVFQQTVNATAGSGLSIDTAAWSNGVYTLSIVVANGDYLEGTFEIDR